MNKRVAPRDGVRRTGAGSDLWDADAVLVGLDGPVAWLFGAERISGPVIRAHHVHPGRDDY